MSVARFPISFLLPLLGGLGVACATGPQVDHPRAGAAAVRGAPKGAHHRGSAAHPSRPLPAALRLGLDALRRRPAPDFVSARAAFERARSLAPKNRQARLNLAYCLLHLDRLPKAAAIYRQLDPARDRAALLGLSETLIRQRRLRSALQLIGPWLKNHPRDQEVITLSAYLLRRTNQHEAALAQIQRALAIDRTNPRAYEQFGRLYLDKKAPRTALMILTRGLRAHPKDAGLLFAHGEAWRDLGELGKAVMDYERAVRANPALVVARLHLGKIYVDNLDYRGALAHFSAVLARWPRHLEATLGVARARFGLGQFRKAVATYKRAIAAHGPVPRALYQIGKIYQDHLDQAPRALVYYRRYVRARGALPKTDPVRATIRMLEALARASRARPRRRAVGHRAVVSPQRNPGGRPQ